MNWPTVALGDISQIISGATPRTSEKRFWDGDVLWATPKDISDLDTPYLDRPPRTITNEGLQSCAASMLPPDSVLLSSRAPIGLVAINRLPVATNQGFKSLVPDRTRLDTKFLYHWLKARTRYLQSLGNGATFKEISKAVVERIEIPLPPLAEQRRIAAILDKADALRRKRKRVIELLDSLTQSIFLEMFDDKKGDRITFGNAVEEFRYGTSNKSGNEGHPVLRIPNVVGGEIDTDDLKYVPLEQREFERLRLLDGDLLLVRTNGNAEYVGRSAVFEETLNRDCRADFVYASYLIRARLKKGLLKPVFVQAFLSSAGGRKAMLERAKTSAGQFNINTQALSSIEIPVPPMEQQLLFSEHVNKARHQMRSVSALSVMANTLFASLQSRAFSGQL